LVVLVGLNIAYLLNTASGAVTSIALADAAQRLLVIPAVSTAGLNVLLTVVLGPLLGVVGVLTGTCVALGAGSMLSMLMFARAYSVRFQDLARPVLVETAIAIACGLAAVPAMVLLLYPAGRGAAIVFGAAALLPYAGVAYLVIIPRFRRSLSLARHSGAVA
jgi:O-antigen/teichoic acid export membrane protein